MIAREGDMMNQVELLNALPRDASLDEIQAYLEKCFALRGFNGQTAKEKLLLLTEELGELAKAIRKTDSASTVDYERIQNYESAESEIADVFIVLVSLCNVLGVELSKVFRDKERQNVSRIWK